MSEHGTSLSRRAFLAGGAAALGLAAVNPSIFVKESQAAPQAATGKPKVYFTPDITPEVLF